MKKIVLILNFLVFPFYLFASQMTSLPNGRWIGEQRRYYSNSEDMHNAQVNIAIKDNRLVQTVEQKNEMMDIVCATSILDFNFSEDGHVTIFDFTKEQVALGYCLSGLCHIHNEIRRDTGELVFKFEQTFLFHGNTLRIFESTVTNENSWFSESILNKRSD